MITTPTQWRLAVHSDTGHNWLVKPTRWNTFKVRWSLQCGVWHILNHTPWWRSGGQFFPCMRCYWLEAVKNPRQHHSRNSRCNAVCSSQSRDFRRRWPSIGYDKHRKLFGNEEQGWGKEIAQNGQGPQLFGDVGGKPNATCYTEGISRLKQADVSSRIFFGHGRDPQSILVTLSTWWCIFI